MSRGIHDGALQRHHEGNMVLRVSGASSDSLGALRREISADARTEPIAPDKHTLDAVASQARELREFGPDVPERDS